LCADHDRDRRLSGELRHVPLERRVHLRRIAKGQVGAADRAGEEEITAERDAVPVERHEPGCVAGHVHDGESQIAAPELLALRELRVRSLRLLEVDAVHLRGARRQVAIVWQVARMQQHRDVEHAAHLGDRADVIDVRVREPDGVER